jgi:serine/threonine protein kinase
VSETLEKDFDNEHHILALLRVIKHPNIVLFHTAFTIDGVPNLLFEPAECNLKDFLRQEYPAATSEQGLLDAFFGLSSGLREIHRYNSKDGNLRFIGCHYDLHPGNVLVKDGKFILSDFGISRLKHEAQGSRSGFKGGLRDYYAPECQDWAETFEAGQIGRPSDIWSLGCILAEVVTFIQLGTTGIREFDDERATKSIFGTFRTFHDNGEPNEKVTKWLQRLHAHSPANETIDGLMDLIRDMLAITQHDRPDILEVSERLFHIAERMRYGRVSEAFASLPLHSDTAMTIERDRMKIWASEVGFDNTRRREESLAWFLTLRFDVLFERIHALLQGIEENLLGLSEIRKQDPHNYELYTVRKSVDELWQILPSETSGRMTRRLETLILDYEATPEARIKLEDLVSYPRPQLLVGIKQALSALEEYQNQPSEKLISQSLLKDRKEWNNKLLTRVEVPNRETSFAIVEYLRYDDDWLDHSDKLILRINNLISLWTKMNLRDLFPVLECRWFCHFPERQAYGLVLPIPHALVQVGDPQVTTLAEMIKGTAKRSKRPNLDEIFVLAFNLATTLASFHKANWLHKGISADNVLFFPKDMDALRNSISSARLVGFSDGRESAEGAFTVGPSEDELLKVYRHPEYRRDAGNIRYREEFDYYSLGMLLLELGRWKLIRTMIKQDRLETLSPEALRLRLLEKEVSQLGSLMGILYQKAVTSCLEGFHMRSEREQGKRQVWEKFEIEVIQSLARCKVICPG